LQPTASVQEVLPPKKDATHLAKHRFKPGRSGNPSGRPKSKPFKEELAKAIAKATKNSRGKTSTNLAQIADSLVREAKSGDVQAIKEIADRLDGKVVQVVEGDVDNPVVTEVRYLVVHATLEDMNDAA